MGKALTAEQNRLRHLAAPALKPPNQRPSQQLLEDAPGLYAITQLRHEPKDFSAKEIKREIQRGEQLRPLYRLAQTPVPQLAISNESIKYYASLVSYYSVYKLKRFPMAATYISPLMFCISSLPASPR